MSDTEDLKLVVKALVGAIGGLEEAVRELAAKADRKPPSSKRGGKGGAS